MLKDFWTGLVRRVGSFFVYRGVGRLWSPDCTLSPLLSFFVKSFFLARRRVFERRELHLGLGGGGYSRGPIGSQTPSPERHSQVLSGCEHLLLFLVPLTELSLLSVVCTNELTGAHACTTTPLHPPPERRDQILLNERCLLKGWTPLHYAAAEGSPSGVSTLLAAGASVSVHGAVLDGIGGDANGLGGGGSSSGDERGGGGGAEAGTALQLARALLSKEGAGPRKKGLQEVARQLSAATQVVERAKEARERKEREAKVGWAGTRDARIVRRGRGFGRRCRPPGGRPVVGRGGEERDTCWARRRFAVLVVWEGGRRGRGCYIE